MKKFDGLLICTDLDGTLFRADKTVSEENLAAIEYFKSEGGIFTFITGRMPYYVDDVYAATRPNAPFGCINGGGIYDKRTGEYLWRQPLPPEAVEIVRYIDESLDGIGIHACTFDCIYFCRENSAMERFRRVTGLPNVTRAYDAIDVPIAKFLFGDLDENRILRTMELLEAHPLADRFHFVRSERTLCEILPQGISKASVLPRLADIMHVDPARIVAIGDYNNDIEMLRTAGIGVAVANARPEVKAVADYITVSNEEHALAAVIRALEDGTLTPPV